MNNKKILLVEDEKALVKVLNLKLTTAGFATTVVFDGEEAINTLRTSGYDLIILDLIMPKKNGYAVLEEIKKMDLKTPVIILSNLGQEEDLEKAKSYGVAEYFVKSNIPLDKIIEGVKKYLV